MQMDSVLYKLRSEFLGVLHKAEKKQLKWRFYPSIRPSVRLWLHINASNFWQIYFKFDIADFCNLSDDSH